MTVGYILFLVGKLTQIPDACVQGDPQAADQLLPLVYDELRRLVAHET